LERRDRLAFDLFDLVIFFWSCLNTKYLLTKGSFSDRCRLLQFNYKDLSIVTGKQGVRTCVVCLTRGPPASPSERTSRLTRVRATVPGHLVSQGRPQSCLQPFKPHTCSGPSRDFGAASVRGQGSGSRTNCHVCVVWARAAFPGSQPAGFGPSVANGRRRTHPHPDSDPGGDSQP